MSLNRYVAHTNQQLAFAKNLLALTPASSALQQRALLQGVLQSLNLALVAYLNELALSVGAGRESVFVSTLQELKVLLERRSQVSPEFNELWQLAEDGWLRQLLALQLAAETFELGAVKAQSQALIATSNQPLPELSAQLLQGYWVKLDDLIVRQREILVEC